VAEIVAEFGDRAVFVTVYIAEAHAMDQWPLGNFLQIKQHKLLQDRIAAAEIAVNRAKPGVLGTVVVDGMDNAFMNAFSCHPERFFVVSSEGKLLWKAQPINAEYPLSELIKAIREAV
jgi:thyroxine 5-deiodinase